MESGRGYLRSMIGSERLEQTVWLGVLVDANFGPGDGLINSVGQVFDLIIPVVGAGIDDQERPAIIAGATDGPFNRACHVLTSIRGRHGVPSLSTLMPQPRGKSKAGYSHTCKTHLLQPVFRRDLGPRIGGQRIQLVALPVRACSRSFKHKAKIVGLTDVLLLPDVYDAGIALRQPLTQFGSAIRGTIIRNTKNEVPIGPREKAFQRSLKGRTAIIKLAGLS